MQRQGTTLSLRKPQEVDILRLKAEDPKQLQKWFSLWKEAASKYPPNAVWCVDETGRFKSYDSLHGKVIAVKGSRVPSGSRASSGNG